MYWFNTVIFLSSDYKDVPDSSSNCYHFSSQSLQMQRFKYLNEVRQKVRAVFTAQRCLEDQLSIAWTLAGKYSDLIGFWWEGFEPWNLWGLLLEFSHSLNYFCKKWSFVCLWKFKQEKKKKNCEKETLNVKKLSSFQR